MIPLVDIKNTIFFDIETIPTKSWNELSKYEIDLWSSIANKIKAKDLSKLNLSDAELWINAGLYPEFGKIISISIGLYNQDKNTIFYKNFTSNDEIEILNNFLSIYDKIYKSYNFYPILGGFNIENFDIQFLIKRLIYNNIDLPNFLNFYGKKPWDIKFLDIAKIWMGIGIQDRYMIKLDVLLYFLGIESSKTEDMWGGSVYDKYLNNKLDEIGDYCDKDVIKTIQAALKLSDHKFNNINIQKF